jgi:hypothetical protein
MADPSKLKGILGLFSKSAPAEEAVNLSRRGVLGLPRQSGVMLPAQAETHLPAVVAPAESPPVIGAIEQVIAEKMAKPTTRREFLGEGVKATASAALRRTLPGALKQATKQLTKPAIDEAAAASKIADYVSSIYNNERNAAEAYKILSNWEVRMAKDQWLNDLDSSIGEYLDPEYATSVWAELINIESRRGAEAARAIGLDPQTIARETGLPASLVKKMVGSGQKLLDEISDAAGTELKMKEIIEDGRGREAARSSSYVDLFEDEPFVDESLQRAMKELGPDADPNDVIARSHDILFDRFKEMERGPSDNLFLGELRKRIVPDEMLDDVWRQAGDEYNTPELITDALKNINTPKNKIDNNPYSSDSLKQNASQALSWINNLENPYFKEAYSKLGPQTFMQHRFANTNSDFTKALSKQVSKRFDEIKSSNPDVPDNMQFELLRSELNFPAELLNVALDRVPRWPGVDHTISSRGKAYDLIDSLKNEMPETDPQTIVDELFKRHGEAYKDKWIEDIAKYSDFAKSKNELPFSPEDKMKVMTTYSGLPAEFIQSILKLTPE